MMDAALKRLINRHYLRCFSSDLRNISIRTGDLDEKIDTTVSTARLGMKRQPAVLLARLVYSRPGSVQTMRHL